MTTRLIALIVSVAWTPGLFAGEPQLVNATPVFPTSQPVYRRPNQYHVFSMRLSPDGKRVLYTRPVIGGEQNNERSARYELVLRDLDGGKETVLPVEPLDRGWRTVCTRFNMFDAAGNRLVLPNIHVEEQRLNEHSTTHKATMNLLIYDTAQDETTNIGTESTRLIAKFTADGQGLIVGEKLATKIVSLKDLKSKPLSVFGYIQSVCPVGGVAVFFVPPTRPAAPPPPGERMQKPPIRLVLWDLKADQELVQLPTHPRNAQLDDLETQWTPNGRYLYYVDVEEVVTEGQGGRPGFRDVTRIWDRQADEPAGEVRDAVPVGPGPAPFLMVLAKRTRQGPGGFLLHDASSGKEYPLGDASRHLIHAYGNRVIYAEKPVGVDEEVVFVADLLVAGTGE